MSNLVEEAQAASKLYQTAVNALLVDIENIVRDDTITVLPEMYVTIGEDKLYELVGQFTFEPQRVNLMFAMIELRKHPRFAEVGWQDQLISEAAKVRQHPTDRYCAVRKTVVKILVDQLGEEFLEMCGYNEIVVHFQKLTLERIKLSSRVI